MKVMIDDHERYPFYSIEELRETSFLVEAEITEEFYNKYKTNLEEFDSIQTKLSELFGDS